MLSRPHTRRQGTPERVLSFLVPGLATPRRDVYCLRPGTFQSRAIHDRSMTTRAERSLDLFRHVTAEKAALYRAIMETFATAKRQFRLHLRPDELLAETRAVAPEHFLTRRQAISMRSIFLGAALLDAERL